MTVKQTRRFVAPTLVRLALAVAAIVALAHGWRSTGVTLVAAGSPCGPTVNPIACENQQAGVPASEWDLGANADQGIQGFATDISVKRGDTVFFKINTPAPQYAIDIYRLGYYQGNGARKMTAAPITVAGSLPQAACFTDATSTSPGTGLIDCGNWNVSASWAVPANAVSGIYLAKMTRTDNGGANHIVFIVRDETSHSGLLFQTSDETDRKSVV